MPDTLSQTLQGWQNFYLLVGTAAATLVGLMFVAISLGSRFITHESIPALRTFVSPTLIHFIYILVIAAVVLVQTMTWMLLGILLVLAGVISFWRSLTTVPYLRQHEIVDMHDWVWYLLAPSVTYLLLVGTGIGLLLRDGWALNGLALASIMLLVAGIRNAWDMVMWMTLRQDESPKRESGAEHHDQGDGKATTEPQAAPVAQPPKVHHDEPTSLALPLAHRADVSRLIREAGLNPSDFTWAVQPSRYAFIGPLVSAVVHTPTACFFRFEFTEDASGQKRISVFVPGEGAREETKAAGSWEDQLEHIRMWLTHLRQHRG